MNAIACHIRFQAGVPGQYRQLAAAVHVLRSHEELLAATSLAYG